MKRTILSVIITRENNLDSGSALIQICLSLVMITDRIELHSVLLPLLIEHTVTKGRTIGKLMKVG